MIDQISAQIAHKLLTVQAFDEKDLPLYQYSLHVLLGTLLNYSAFIIVGLLFGMFWENVAIIISFSIIRKFAGGYHADKYRNCFLGSIVIDIACLLIVKSITGVGVHILIGITALSFMLICICSPVEHKNKQLNPKEKRVFKLVAIALSGVFFLASLILLFIESYVTISVAMEVGIVLSSILMIAGKVLQMHQAK